VKDMQQLENYKHSKEDEDWKLKEPSWRLIIFPERTEWHAVPSVIPGRGW
jgi:hypothetical protein